MIAVYGQFELNFIGISTFRFPVQVVISVEAVSYNMKTHDHLGKLTQVRVYILSVLKFTANLYCIYCKYRFAVYLSKCSTDAR